VCIVPELLVRLPLSAPDEWAIKALDVVQCGKISREAALQAVSRTEFSIQRSGLSQLYLAAAD
jgi:hypothetical protein